MKRTFLFESPVALVTAGTALVAATYGLVRLTFGLFLPDVQTSLGLGTREAGYISSGSSLLYCLGALVGLFAGRRPRRLVVAAAATACLGSVGMALSPGVAVFAGFAVLSSMGAGLASPGLVAIIAGQVPTARRDRAQAVVNAGVGPGLVAAGLLALLLLPDWRLAWILVAVFTALTAVAVLVLDRPAAGRSGAGASAAPSRSWLGRHRVPILSAVLLGAASAVVWTYGRSHLVAEGATERGSVTAWIALGAGGAAAILSARRLASLPATRAWSIAVGGLASAAVGLGVAAHHLPVALLACAVFGWGFTAATSALITWAGRIDPERAAAGTSLLFVALVLGQALGSTGAGLLAEGLGLAPAFLTAGAVAAVAAAVPVASPDRSAVSPAG